MSSSPQVSVVMSVYNGEKYLAESIESILAQTFRDFEFIIIDDGSTDDSARIIASFHDERIVALTQSNQGLPRSLNRGIRHARGQYIARQDADDISLPRRLSVQVESLVRHPDTALVGTNLLIINPQGEIIGRDSSRATDDLELKWRLLFSNPFAHPSVMIRRQIFEEVGFYSESSDYLYIEDYELWSRIGPRYRMINLTEPLVKYRNHLTNISNRDRNAQFNGACRISAHNIDALVDPPQLSHEEIAWLITLHSIPMRLTCEQVAKTLTNVERLFDSFCRTYSVGPEAQRGLLLRIRAQLATFLLDAAVGHGYIGNYALASQLGNKAAALHRPSVLRDRRYWMLVLKLGLGSSTVTRLRELKSRFMP